VIITVIQNLTQTENIFHILKECNSLKKTKLKEKMVPCQKCKGDCKEFGSSATNLKYYHCEKCVYFGDYKVEYWQSPPISWVHFWAYYLKQKVGNSDMTRSYRKLYVDPYNFKHHEKEICNRLAEIYKVTFVIFIDEDCGDSIW